MTTAKHAANDPAHLLLLKNPWHSVQPLCTVCNYKALTCFSNWYDMLYIYLCVCGHFLLKRSFSCASLLLSVIICCTSPANKATETVQEISTQHLLIHYGVLINFVQNCPYYLTGYITLKLSVIWSHDHNRLIICRHTQWMLLFFFCLFFINL